MRHSISAQLVAALKRLVHREMYPSEFIGYCCEGLACRIKNGKLKKFLQINGFNIQFNNADKRMLKYFDGKSFNLNGCLLPDVRENKIIYKMLAHNYGDIFYVHCEKKGNYHFQVADPLDRRLAEGPYFYIGPKNEKIILKEGDTVIDAGAWIGDFSALAAHLVGEEGIVYAFEPSNVLMGWLRKTASNHLNIKPIPLGLGSENHKFQYTEDEGGGGHFSTEICNDGKSLEIVRLDDWAKENNISKIDFIKADIEGFEREMIAGAHWVLKEFGPKLSICTYHLADDPIVLEKKILDINPNSKIIQRRSKLFAYI
jgi:FkbM family methyltransferase